MGTGSEIFWQGSSALYHSASLAGPASKWAPYSFPTVCAVTPYSTSENCLELLSSVLRALYVKATGDLKGKIWRGL